MYWCYYSFFIDVCVYVTFAVTFATFNDNAKGLCRWHIETTYCAIVQHEKHERVDNHLERDDGKCGKNQGKDKLKCEELSVERRGLSNERYSEEMSRIMAWQHDPRTKGCSWLFLHVLEYWSTMLNASAHKGSWQLCKLRWRLLYFRWCVL